MTKLKTKSRQAKILITLGLIVSIFALSTQSALAKKVLPKFSTSKSTKTKVSTRGITTTVRLRSDRRALIVSFDNLTIAKSINYVLTYTTNGIDQGFEGSVSPTLSAPQTREIVFGTCSAGICRYDTKIKNAKFTVTTTLASGKKIVKSFKIKI